MNLFKSRNNVITYTVNKREYSNLYISVQNGEVIINAPWYMASSQIQEIVEEKKQWILNKIKEYEIACEKRKIKEYTRLKIVKVLGINYDLAIKYKNIKTPNLSIEQGKILVILPNKYKKLGNDEIVKILIEKMYNMVAKKEIERAMEKTRIMVGIAPEDYEIKRIEGTLGKCLNEKITINPNIVKYSRETIEYIILHEFCHLKYKNHTKSFYNMIKTYIPKYKEIESELKGKSY
ncbi:MAG: M48 family metallopeptidase [Clostridia bacterium]|nr:M48 family metallopeptidase [Clostridia bacterium]